MLDGSQHDSRADIWSLGCVINSICSFDFPFNAQSEKRLIEKIKTVAHKPIEGTIQQEVKDLYDICMNKNFQTRPFTNDLLGLEMV
jgi:serine/threonine protein kinase